MKITARVEVDESEFVFIAAKSSGPGGQKVNKTNSQIQLRWDFEGSPSLDSSSKDRAREKLKPKLTKDGFLIITSEGARSQHFNKQACKDKFVEILQAALFIPKVRKKTKPTKASKKRRLENKKRRSDTKKLRQKKYD